MIDRLSSIFFLVVCLMIGPAEAATANPAAVSPSLNSPIAARSGQSFECARAIMPVERIICADPVLAAEDRTIARLYALSLHASVGPGSSGQRQIQRKWITERDQCVGQSHQTKACVADAQKSRISELAVSTLFRDPTLALDALQSSAPESYPIYKALYLYVTAKDRAERLRTVEPLVKQLISSEPINSNDQDTFFSIDLGKPDARQATAAEIATNDMLFGGFLNYVTISSTQPLPSRLPCDALVRRPGLFDALGAKFGSTQDNFLIQSDCDAMQPLPAAVETVTKAAWDSISRPMGGCTIRFAAYRAAARTQTMISLGLAPPAPLNWMEDEGDTEEAFGRFDSKNRALVAASDLALARYYQAISGRPPRVSQAYAKAAVRALIEAILDSSCG